MWQAPWNEFNIVDDLQEGISGDLNNDGIVNTGDLSELYTWILRGGGNNAYDLNEDKAVNAGDVSSLYTVILKQ